MKRFFGKPSKPLASPINSPATNAPSSSKSTPSTLVLASPALPHSSGLKPKDVVPAVPHPYPHDHLALLATKDGLLIRPHTPGLDQGQAYIKLSWGKEVDVKEIVDGGVEHLDWKESVVTYGIVGILELFSKSYLLVITARSEVGNVIDVSHTIYCVKSVTAIPLVEDRARTTLNTIASRNAGLSRPSLLRPPIPETFTTTLEENTNTPHVKFSSETDIKILASPPSSEALDDTDDHLQVIASPQSSSSDLSTPSEFSSSNSPVYKTLATRLSFWSRLSKRNSAGSSSPSADQPHPLAISDLLATASEHEALNKLIEEGEHAPSKVLGDIIAATAPPPATIEERHSELEEKIVRECVKEFTKGGMFFAYNFDITRSLQHKQERILTAQRQHDLLAGLGALPSHEKKVTDQRLDTGGKVSALSEPYPTLPLWRCVDKQFWWNEWLSRPFVDAGLHPYVLPIMQGHCQVSQFTIPPDLQDENVVADYIIISRRSRDRAGLRYQRRGIDDEAHVANFVETETIMRVEREEKENIFSYVQIRGSIPLFWTQTGYGLKPPPLLANDRTHVQNMNALKRHFERTIPQYGPLTAVNLAEQHGKEAAITRSYREFMGELNSKDAVYCEYDFHAETKGMKYENITKLIQTMERTFDHQGYLWISDDVIFSQQKGIYRVNCIDCLDRTNVVQSAFARYVLNKQLGALALLNPSTTGVTEIDYIFNNVWANNGDAISRAYAGTSALKGDFTRTGKRDLSGMLNDGVNSLARMYTSTFSDWFCQAVIDFMLGNRTLTVFSEFLLRLQSSDPRDLIRLSKIRAEAIATSVSRVLPEGERLLSGWTLFAPEDLNTRIGLKFEEKVLLLSIKALYIICYDYTLEKVKLYTRVPLGDIVKITKGAYILSPLEEASRDPEQNAGFVVTWLNSNQESRVTSYSVRNSLDVAFVPPIPTVPRRSSNPLLVTRSLTRMSMLPPFPNATAKWPAASARQNETNFAAFKVLPIDPARIRRASSSSGDVYSAASDELNGAANCREAVDLIVQSIYRACEDVGSAQGNFVINEDVVGLAEAQRTTSVYAKMEYGIKRLLWLGG